MLLTRYQTKHCDFAFEWPTLHQFPCVFFIIYDSNNIFCDTKRIPQNNQTWLGVFIVSSKKKASFPRYFWKNKPSKRGSSDCFGMMTKVSTSRYRPALRSYASPLIWIDVQKLSFFPHQKEGRSSGPTQQLSLWKDKEVRKRWYSNISLNSGNIPWIIPEIMGIVP